MNLLFACSSLEAGRDGVGDYTRLIAQECVRQGHRCSLIALNDGFVNSIAEGVDQADDYRISQLRLPKSTSWAARIAAAQTYITRHPPDWISLQFVPYGFHAKGIIWNSIAPLAQILSGYRTHIMFHELWLGESKTASFRNRLVGLTQRHFIKKLVRSVKPRVCHTSNETYAAVLARNGIDAQVLALFGNIPIQEPKPRAFGPADAKRDSLWIVGVFGTIHPQWEPEPFLTALIEAAEKNGKKILMVAIGRLGESGEKTWSRMVEMNSGRASFKKYGELSAEEISQLLHSLDLGVSCTPARLFGKSGTGASMIEHGIPVVITRTDFEPRVHSTGVREPELHRLVHIFRPDEVLDAPGLIARRAPPLSRRPLIAAELLRSLH